MKIVICEFMDESAVDALRQRFEVRYDPALVDRRAELERLLADAEALVVRNRPRSMAGCSTPRRGCGWSAAWGWDWTTSTWRPARHAAWA